MSELAKFVAATLQERVAVDLEEENKALQKKNERLEAMHKAERTRTLEYASLNGTVEISGKDGVPVYAHGEMKDSGFVSGHRYLDLTSNEDAMLCPITKMKEAEIRLNGLLVVTLSERDEIYDPYDPNGFSRWYSFNPKTHGVGRLWNNRTLKLHMVSWVPASRDGTPEKVRFQTLDLVEEVQE